MIAHLLAVLGGDKGDFVEEIAVDLHGVEGDVVLDGLIEQKAHAAPVLRDHGHAAFQGVGRVVEGQRLPKELDLVGGGGIEAHDAVGDADLALTGQSAHAEDLALAHVEVHALDVLAGHIDDKVLYGKGDVGVFVFRLRRGGDHGLALASDHQLRELDQRGLALFAGGGQFAVAEDGNVVGGGHDFIQTVGDEDDGDAALGDLFHDGKQRFRLGLRQNGGRLVKHQQADALFVDLAGDLDELHVADRQALDQRVLVQSHAHAVQRLAGVLTHGGHVEVFQILQVQRLAEDAGPGDLAVQFDVLGDGEARQEHELLMHHADARVHGVVGRKDIRLFAAYEHFAVEAAGGMDDRHAEQHVHQRGFSRAVFTKQRVDLAGAHRQRHVREHGGLAVSLGYVFHFQHVFCAQCVFLP